MTCRKHKERINAMTNNKSDNLSAKGCGYCDSKKTDIINKEGTLVFRWLRDPYRKGTWICGTSNRREMHQTARIAAQIRDRVVKKEKGKE